MIFYSIILAFSFAVTYFIAWRLRRSLADGRAAVRGAVFYRATQPLGYWFTVITIIVAAMLAALVTGLFAYGIYAGRLS